MTRADGRRPRARAEADRLGDAEPVRRLVSSAAPGGSALQLGRRAAVDAAGAPAPWQASTSTTSSKPVHALHECDCSHPMHSRTSKAQPFRLRRRRAVRTSASAVVAPVGVADADHEAAGAGVPSPLPEVELQEVRGAGDAGIVVADRLLALPRSARRSGRSRYWRARSAQRSSSMRLLVLRGRRHDLGVLDQPAGRRAGSGGRGCRAAPRCSRGRCRRAA